MSFILHTPFVDFTRYAPIGYIFSPLTPHIFAFYDKLFSLRFQRHFFTILELLWLYIYSTWKYCTLPASWSAISRSCSALMYTCLKISTTSSTTFWVSCMLSLWLTMISCRFHRLWLPQWMHSDKVNPYLLLFHWIDA